MQGELPLIVPTHVAQQLLFLKQVQQRIEDVARCDGRAVGAFGRALGSALGVTRLAEQFRDGVLFDETMTKNLEAAQPTHPALRLRLTVPKILSERKQRGLWPVCTPR